MKVKIKRFDKSIPMPEYKTSEAACFDAYSRETITIEPGEIGYILLNNAIEVPEGYYVMLVPRSSTHKHGIMAANSFGVGDRDFRGNNDEYAFIALNFTKNPVTIEKGTRVAQYMVVKYEQADIEEVDYLEGADRGGIGSTGSK